MRRGSRAQEPRTLPKFEGSHRSRPVLPAGRPDGGFYLWAQVPGGDDERFVRDLYAATNVTLLPGQYLGREAHGVNPGRGYVRIALVPELSECVDAASRIVDFCR